jgi:hypothetical protein
VVDLDQNNNTIKECVAFPKMRSSLDGYKTVNSMCKWSEPVQSRIRNYFRTQFTIRASLPYSLCQLCGKNRTIKISYNNFGSLKLI